MAAKHQSATPLPWVVDDENAIFADNGGNDFVACCDLSPDGEKNAMFIVHAANKYPQAVEALREIAVTSKGYPNASREGEIARAALVRIDETPYGIEELDKIVKRVPS